MICLTLGCSLFSNFVTSRQFVYEKLEKQSLWSFWKGRDSKFCWRRLERKPNRFFRRKSQFTRGCLRETRMNPGQFDSSAMGLKEIDGYDARCAAGDVWRHQSRRMAD